MTVRAASAERDLLGLWPLIVPALGFYLPMAMWLWQEPPGVPTAAFATSHVGLVLANTLGIAAFAAVGAGLLGTVEALCFAAFPVRGRAFLEPLLLLPFLLPPAVVTSAAHALLAGGPCGFLIRGVGGAVFLSAWQMTPIVFWGVTSAIRGIDRAERQALRVTLSPWRGALRVLLPRVRGSVRRMVFLVFALLLPAREIAGYAGVETLGDRVLAAFTAVRDASEGWVLTGLLALVTVPLIVVVLRGERRAGAPSVNLAFASVGARGTVDPAASAIVWALALSWTIPWIALVARAASHSVTTLGIWMEGLALETARCAVLAVIVVGFGWRLAHTRQPWVLVVCSVPLLVPGSLGSLALLETVQHELPRSWVGPVLLNLAQAARVLGIAVLLGLWALASIPRAQREAAGSLLGPRARRWRVLLPLGAPFLAIAALIVWVILLGDIEVAALLMPPGHLSPVVELHQFLHFRHDAQAAQLAVGIGAVGVLSALGLGAILRTGRSTA